MNGFILQLGKKKSFCNKDFCLQVGKKSFLLSGLFFEWNRYILKWELLQ